MENNRRYNKIIDLLENGQVVFAPALVSNGPSDDITYIADSDYDMVMIEMEHDGFSFDALKATLNTLLNRRRIFENQTLQPSVVPFVRIPPNANEHNQWIIKQTLDTGVYGIIIPHLTTVQDAIEIVSACRYPQLGTSRYKQPEGHRGWSNKYAPRYWGLSPEEYYQACDLWPLNPNGNLILMAIIEDQTGVDNLRDILSGVPGIGIIWAGPGDMAVSMGLGTNIAHPDVQKNLLTILETCKEFGVACATAANSPEQVALRIDQGFSVIITPILKSSPGLTSGLNYTRRLKP